MASKEVRRIPLIDSMQGTWMRLAASGLFPARWYLPALPQAAPRPANDEVFHLEIVSHSWQYVPFLTQQLNSLIRFPPAKLKVTMTVYYSDADLDTEKRLEAYEGKAPSNVQWNWQRLAKEALFRRAIGRNQAARQSTADWIWFTDCDVLFRDDCLDTLASELRGRTDPLVYPANERVTPLLPASHPMINPELVKPFGPDVDPGLFAANPRSCATGPLQIMHGDVARECGYCESLSYYQKPVPQWAKCYEDRALRWLLRTHGTPVDIPGVYRIRHQVKGRYRGGWNARLRRVLRRRQKEQQWHRG